MKEDNVRKAFTMLAAAILAKPPKTRVKRVARKRPAESDPDLSMPAGSLYDVVGQEDIP
jgi:hypothetical protein